MSWRSRYIPHEKEKLAPQVALVQLYYKRHARFSYKMSYYSYSLSFPIAISHICKPYRSLMRWEVYHNSLKKRKSCSMFVNNYGKYWIDRYHEGVQSLFSNSPTFRFQFLEIEISRSHRTRCIHSLQHLIPEWFSGSQLSPHLFVSDKKK